MIGTVRGREPGYIVVGAHYDTKDLPGFVGANDGASGTAVVAELARTVKRPRHTIQFVFFDGEESPARGTRLRSSSASGCAARRWPRAASTTRARWCCSTSWATGGCASRARRNSSAGLWRKLRAAAKRVGAAAGLPGRDRRAPSPTTTSRSCAAAFPSIDLIDFDFPCWHQPCDDLDVVSERSVDAVGETILELIRRL